MTLQVLELISTGIWSKRGTRTEVARTSMLSQKQRRLHHIYKNNARVESTGSGKSNAERFIDTGPQYTVETMGAEDQVPAHYGIYFSVLTSWTNVGSEREYISI
jgi:hypothetical protein